MRIGVPKETAAGEHRVALVPEVVSKLRAKGLDVMVQAGAGSGALLPDAAFEEAGASVASDAPQVWASDLVVVIAPPGGDEIRSLRAGAIVVGKTNVPEYTWSYETDNALDGRTLIACESRPSQPCARTGRVAHIPDRSEPQFPSQPHHD